MWSPHQLTRIPFRFLTSTLVRCPNERSRCLVIVSFCNRPRLLVLLLLVLLLLVLILLPVSLPTFVPPFFRVVSGGEEETRRDEYGELPDEDRHQHRNANGHHLQDRDYLGEATLPEEPDEHLAEMYR